MSIAGGLVVWPWRLPAATCCRTARARTRRRRGARWLCAAECAGGTSRTSTRCGATCARTRASATSCATCAARRCPHASTSSSTSASTRATSPTCASEYTLAERVRRVHDNTSPGRPIEHCSADARSAHTGIWTKIGALERPYSIFLLFD